MYMGIARHEDKFSLNVGWLHQELRRGYTQNSKQFIKLNRIARSLRFFVVAKLINILSRDADQTARSAPLLFACNNNTGFRSVELVRMLLLQYRIDDYCTVEQNSTLKLFNRMDSMLSFLYIRVRQEIHMVGHSLRNHF